LKYLRSVGITDPELRDRAQADACCEANKNEPMRRAMRELAPRRGSAAFGQIRIRSA